MSKNLTVQYKVQTDNRVFSGVEDEFNRVDDIKIDYFINSGKEKKSDEILANFNYFHKLYNNEGASKDILIALDFFTENYDIIKENFDGSFYVSICNILSRFINDYNEDILNKCSELIKQIVDYNSNYINVFIQNNIIDIIMNSFPRHFTLRILFALCNNYTGCDRLCLSGLFHSIHDLLKTDIQEKLILNGLIEIVDAYACTCEESKDIPDVIYSLLDVLCNLLNTTCDDDVADKCSRTICSMIVNQKLRNYFVRQNHLKIYMKFKNANFHNELSYDGLYITERLIANHFQYLLDNNIFDYIDSLLLSDNTKVRTLCFSGLSSFVSHHQSVLSYILDKNYVKIGIDLAFTESRSSEELKRLMFFIVEVINSMYDLDTSLNNFINTVSDYFNIGVFHFLVEHINLVDKNDIMDTLRALLIPIKPYAFSNWENYIKMIYSNNEFREFLDDTIESDDISSCALAKAIRSYIEEYERGLE